MSSRKQCLLDTARQMLIWCQKDWEHAQGQHLFKLSGFPVLRDLADTTPIPNQEALSSYHSLQRKMLVFSSKVPLCILWTSSSRSHVQQLMTNTKWTQWYFVYFLPNYFAWALFIFPAHYWIQWFQFCVFWVLFLCLFLRVCFSLKFCFCCCLFVFWFYFVSVSQS